MSRQRREEQAELVAQMKEAARAEEFHAAMLEALARLRAKASQAEEEAGPAPRKSKLIQVNPGKIEKNHPGAFA